MRQLRRVAIVNRGEAAIRLVHTVRELNAGPWVTTGPGAPEAASGPVVETVALFTDEERTALFVREADLVYPLGPASARPYLDHAVLERALRETGADAVWPGWGFVAEDPGFAELCERLGITFVGPSPRTTRLLGDKINAKLLAEESSVPVAPWSGGGVADTDAALAAAHRIGYPLMLKAAAGGGGRGIRVVADDAQLLAVLDRTREEARRSFGSDVVFLESLVTGARHVEVQIIADGQGTAWAVGVRDCSVQRRNQKLIEESASPVLTPEQNRELRDAAVRLALASGYRGAGTVEFLHRPETGSSSFLEVNTRLQVEHPVTEAVTGLDLVALQLHVAAGGRLEGDPPVETGHAIEVRLNAEDPERDFAAAPGRIALLRLPGGPGVRVDTGYAEGDVIPADFDSMIAKIVVHAPDRPAALARIRRALTETTVVIDGGTTNKSFLLDLLDCPEVLTGRADTGWIDRARSRGGLPGRRDDALALVAAAIDAYDEEDRAVRARFLLTAHGGRAQVTHDPGRTFELRISGAVQRVRVAKTGHRRYRVTLGGSTADAVLDRIDSFTGRLTLGRRTARIVLAANGPVRVVEVDGVVHRITADEGGLLRAAAPALVVAVQVEVGQEVLPGETVAIVESMKMETAIEAPFAGRVREVLATVGTQVEVGAPLVCLDPLDTGSEAAAPSGTAAEEDRAVLLLPEADHPASARARALRQVEDLRNLLLGFDLTAAEGRGSLAGYQTDRIAAVEETVEETAEARHVLFAAELDLLTAFADLCELSRNRPAAEDGADERAHSPREYFHTYLHSLDVDRERLPEAFREKLARAVAHYGVTDLSRGADLEEAVFRIFLAQQRVRTHLPVVTALLERWLGEARPGEPLCERARVLLDRLVVATQLRFPVVGDLARSIRFRWVEQPLVEAYQERSHDEVHRLFATLDTGQDTPGYAERVEELVAGAEPLTRCLAERISSDLPAHDPTLEVLARRRYGGHDLTEVRYVRGDGLLPPHVTCACVLDGRPTRVLGLSADVDDLAPVADVLTCFLGAVPDGVDVVVDLHLAWLQAPADVDEAAVRLGERLRQLPLTGPVRRITVATSVDGGKDLRQFTFRPVPDGALAEDPLIRGVHPMVALLLGVSRLSDFDVTRLPAPDDVLLYRCQAHGNPSDQRLVAFAQVRELTVVRDHAGRASSLPQVEQVLASCLDGIRRARAELKAERAVDGRGRARTRLDANHVFLYVWPLVEAPLAELTSLSHAVAPLTGGAGLTETVIEGRVATTDGEPRSVAVRFTRRPGSGVVATVSEPDSLPLRPLGDYEQKVLQSRQRGTVYPYELLPQLAGRDGSFVEYDLDADPAAVAGPDAAPLLVPVRRPPGRNTAGIVAGVVSTPTERYPEGMRRVVLLGDPTKALGAVAEPECLRICAALDLAERLGAPVEWFTLSAGARISMDSGTENMDWVARALRRIIEFTQAGGEINVVVAGINVGAQPYWNAEATMLMHTKGILVMTPDSAMVLTGKRALDYSGGVSAEDNHGIGGYDRVMGPNGQAQYWAPDLSGAVEVLFRHYEHTYRAPGERFPRPAAPVRTPPSAMCATIRSPVRPASSRPSGRSSAPRPTPNASGRSTSAR